MADPEWSQLPKELLHLIAEYLPSEIDILRFRSVCSTWRSSVPSNLQSPFPSRFPILPHKGIAETSWGFYLSRRSIFILSLPHPSHQTSPLNNGWIVKLDRENPNRMRLINPLSRSSFTPLPPRFPKLFDFSKFQVHELGQEFTLQYINYRPLANSIGEAGNLYMEKVAFCLEKEGFLLLTIHVSGKLVMYRSGDTKWTVINDLPAPYDDVIYFKRCFYAVDNTGRAVVVNITPNSAPDVSAVAGSVFGGDKKFLVESFGELLLVDMYLSVGPEDDVGYNDGFEFYEEFDCFMSERTVKFKVYRLNGEGEMWVEVTSLEDKILFLGDNCSFSALASEFGSVCKGNCIVFTDQFFCGREEDVVWKSRGVGVFDMENGSIGPIGSYNGYTEMFWPPPSWVYSALPIEAGLDQLTL